MWRQAKLWLEGWTSLMLMVMGDLTVFLLQIAAVVKEDEK